MNWFSWILVVAVSYGVQGQIRRGVQRSAVTRRFPRLFCFRNNRIYMAGQQFPSNDGCNTCTCNGYDRVTCTEIGCLTTTPPTGSPCKVGQPLPRTPCGGWIDKSCPNNYECLVTQVPGRFDNPGVCCRKAEPVVELCQLPSETGLCKAAIQRWYYNKKEGKCLTFSYGGCGGNANRFTTKAACEQRCGKELCKLHSHTGSCEGFYPSWSYNYSEKRCKEFVYGGCYGNPNRFETQAECQKRCGSEPVCAHGEPLSGRACGGMLPGNDCPSGYTCVGELVPVDGPGVCCPSKQVVELCQLPSEAGLCKAGIQRWYYNKKEGKCLTFIYGGCGGNANRFTTKAACEQRCGKELCKLPSLTGSCEGFYPRWYYNDSEKRCKQFIYGGCYGNPNRFETQAECQKRCGSEPVCTHGEPLSGRACGGMLPGNDCPSGYTCVGELVPVDGPGVCCPSKQVVELCQLPSETGLCKAGIQRWYYNKKEGKCLTFIYGGCGGNANRFTTKAACEQRCGKELCKLPSHTGSCDGFYPRWYYNDSEKRCKQFIYGGCYGNPNRFETQAECQKRCGSEPVCAHGEPLSGRTCGGMLPGNDCPSGYTCVGELVPVDGPGVCCPSKQEPVCNYGKPLAGRTCGERRPRRGPRRRPWRRPRRRLRRQCPRGYECVGDQLAFGGQGVCCPRDPGPSTLVCPTAGPRQTGRACTPQCFSNADCPRGQVCCHNGCGNMCTVGVPKTHQLCPRLNPLIRLHCFRFEQCPQRGCPGQEECCPNHCGSGCIALRPPCGVQSPLRDSSGRQMFCGRGRNRVDCPSDHYCSTEPSDRYAVCCPYH